MAKYGYIRVSTKDQSTARQEETMAKYEIENRKVFTDKASGKDFDREGWQTLLKVLDKGDELFIHSLDRLGRNKNLIKDALAELKSLGVIVRIVDMPLTMQDNLDESMQEMINNIMIEVYSYVAETERLNTLKRQGEGIAKAKENGVYQGAKRQYEIDDKFIKTIERVERKEISNKEAYTLLGMSKATYFNMKKSLKGGE